MRYGLLGDIHGNLTALETVIDFLESEGVDQFFSVGDIVGYGASPSECIELLIEKKVRAVKGNHDAACLREISTEFFNPHARRAVEWTRDQLDAEHMNWLSELPMVLTLPECSIVHGTLDDPDQFEYVQCTDDADPTLDEMVLPICFAGHTHVPVTIVRLLDDITRTAFTLEPEIDLSELSRAFINVGSVGQPRDEDPRAAASIFDTDTDLVHMRRIAYDISKAAQSIRNAGLPPILADRLFLGV